MVSLSLSSPLSRIGKHRYFSLPSLLWSRLLVVFVTCLVPTTSIAIMADVSPEHSKKAPLAFRSLLLDCISLEGLVVAVGERGHILVSEDRGQSWQQANVPTRSTLTGVYFYNRNLGWAVGHDAIILRTVNGGRNWERLYFAPEEERPLLDVWFRDTANGIAVGAYGLFLVTSDGGDTWSHRKISEDDFHLNHIVRSITGQFYIAAEAGRIYHSSDEGETWIELPSPYKGSFFGTLPLRSNKVIVFGLRGHMYLSEDAGKTWVQIETATKEILTNGLILSDGTIVVVGQGGTVLVSTDEAHSFTLRQQADRQGFASVVMMENGTLIAVGEFGVNRLPIGQ